MTKEFSRSRRVGEQIQKELAQLIQMEVKDPRVRWVTVSAVAVNHDMSHATVYFTLMGHDRQSAETENAQKVLNKIATYFKRELGRRMRMRAVPDLHFQYDESIERGFKLTQLIDEAIAKDTKSDK